jgi:CRP/FNR family transcriptional regulator, cyclic AMP receptor protein
MATEDARRLLGECLLFRELEAEERNALVARAQIRAYSAGETIFGMGSAGDHLMAVLSGSVSISVRSSGGKEIVLAIMQPGEFFGEIALRRQGKSRRRPGDNCLPPGDPCSRLRSTDQHIAELALLQLPTRLAKVLLRFARVERGTADGHRLLQVHLSQRELGNICGAGARASTNAWAYGSVAASCRSKNASSRSPTGLPSKNWHSWKALPRAVQPAQGAPSCQLAPP